MPIKQMEFFTAKEFACRCCGKVYMDTDLLDKIDRLRGLMGHPLVINSGWRCDDHNRAVGGAANSFHKRGMAVDVSTRHVDRGRLIYHAHQVGFTGFGFYDDFIHLDIGPKRFWDQAFAF